MTILNFAEYLQRLKRSSAFGWVTVFCVLLLLFSGGCGENKKRKAELATKKGMDCLAQNKYVGAEKYFALALENDQLNPTANFGMGQIYFELYADNAQALMYYERCRDIREKNTCYTKATSQAAFLKKMLEGKIEDPAYVLRDMLLAVKESKQNILFERLTPQAVSVEIESKRTPEMLFKKLAQQVRGKKYEIKWRKFLRNNKEVILLAENKDDQRIVLNLTREEPLVGIWKISNIRFIE